MTPGGSPRVFLSYARKDGESFAVALRRRLAVEQPEITVWQDRAELEGGVGWWTQIEAALDHVKFLVIVLTPHAIVSEVTRQEWRYARQRGVIVYPVKGVPDDRLNYAALPNWMRKAHFFDIGQWTGHDWRDPKEWQTFVNYLKSDRTPHRVPFMAPPLPRGFVARPHEFESLVRLVLDPEQLRAETITTALQGSGGYGKTTLAIALCHDERMADAFDDGVLWTSLGQSPSVLDELAKWYEALAGERPAFVDISQAATTLAEKLASRNCLLIVDDVWEWAHLEPFLRGAQRCARVVTTRRVDLLHGAPRVRVDEMRTAEAIRVLATALPAGAVADERLAALASRLGEWPLLLKLAAGMIQKRLDRGDSATGALTFVELLLKRRGVLAFDAREGIRREDAVSRTISASRELLDDADDRRLLDLAIFSEQTAIPLTTLERLWGLDEVDAAECAQRLDDVALLTLDLRRGVVSLHDVMSAYLRGQGVDITAGHQKLVAAYGDVLRLPDDYAWRWLPYHFTQAGYADRLRSLLLRPEWLHAQLRAVGPYALVRSFDGARDVVLRTIEGSLRLALSVLAVDSSQLYEQLLGRLPEGASEELDAFRRQIQRAAPIVGLHAKWPNLTGNGSLVQTLPHAAVNGALVLSDQRVLSWSGDATLRVWDLTTGEGRLLIGHAESVTGAQPLPDGRVLSWSDDATLRVWDLATGEGRALVGHERSINGALRMDDGRVVSWSEDGTLRVWELADGDTRTLSGHDGSVNGVLALSDGRLLSWGRDGTMRLWDVETGHARVILGHAESINGALLLPDGRVLSWSSDATVRVWKLATGENRPIAEPSEPVEGALTLPDGRVLLWSSEPMLRLWDPATETWRELVGHEGWVNGVLVLPDGRVLSWSGDGTLRVWDLATGEGTALVGHDGWVHGALASPDGQVLSWSADGTLRVWDLATRSGRTLTGHDFSVNGALLLADRRVLSWSGDGTLRVWDLATGDELALTGHKQQVNGAQLLSDGRVLSWSRDGTLAVWDLAANDGRPLIGHYESVKGALVLPDGRVLSWSSYGAVRMWDLATGEGHAFVDHEGSVKGALVLPDGRLLSWSSHQVLRVKDLVTGAGRTLAGHGGSVNGARVLADGRVLSWSGDATLRVWDLATGEGHALTGHGESVDGSVALADGRVLSWSADATLRVWDVATGEAHALIGHDARINGALVMPDERVLSWSDDTNLRVWDLATADARVLAGHDGWINGALVLPDRRALSWSADATLRVWDLATGKGRVLTGHDGSVNGAIDLGAGRLLSWSGDRSVRCRKIDGDGPGHAFYFDSVPTVVLPVAVDRFFVGDALGRVHLLEFVGAD